MEGTLHSVRLDQSTVWGNGAILVADGKDSEEVDEFDVQVREVGIDLDAAAEGGPEDPVPVSGKGTGRYDASSGHCCCSMEISMEVIALGSWQSVQPLACGYQEWKWVSRASSDRCHSLEQSSAMLLAGPGM